MSANQRRSGFRLPWLADEDESGATAGARGDATPASGEPQPGSGEAAASSADAQAPTDAPPATDAAQAAEASTPAPAADAPTVTETTPASAAAATTNGHAAAAPAAGAVPDTSNAFIRDLVAAMRKVADEARSTGVDRLKADADEAVRGLEADAERRRQELRERAETDITGVGEWARAEAERIKAEAEQRVTARRAQLEQQLAAEGTRAETEAKALRDRVTEYERELEAFHAQLSEINDPAAFAAAAKRMPAPPSLTPGATAVPDAGPTEPTTASAPPSTPAAEAASDTPAAPTSPEVHPAEEEVLASRLAELDRSLESPSPDTAPAAQAGSTAADAPAGEAPTAATPAAGAPSAATPAADQAEVSTDIVVKGLGSFGAITGFRQSLSAQQGIISVALSLGQSGEFVFRATHAPGFDLGDAIRTMEGDGATVEPRPEGGLRVTLERSR